MVIYGKCCVTWHVLAWDEEDYTALECANANN